MNLVEVKKALKAIASAKCRLAKQSERKDYDERMSKILTEEARLIKIRGELTPERKIFVTEMTKADIKLLDMDETKRAARSIQSKKHHAQYKPDKTEYNEACRIEQMLVEHRKELQPDTVKVNKSTVAEIMEDTTLTAKQKLQKIQEMIT